MPSYTYTVAAEPLVCCTRAHNINTRPKPPHTSCYARLERLCQLPNIELIAPNGRDCGHKCRGGCGGKLHGTCGEVEDPDGDNDNHRICHTCTSNRSLLNPAKRKQGQDFVRPRASKKTSGAAGAKKPRKRLNLGEKLEVLALLDGKVSYAEIARRYGCGTTAIGTVKIKAILNALSVGVKEVAAKRGGVQDLCEVLSHLGIVPGMPAPLAAIKAVEFWVELEEQEEVAKALAADTEAMLIEKMNDKFTEDSDADEEEELNNTGEVESAEGGRLMAPPPYSDLSGLFGPLEQYAQAAGNTEAGHFLRKAKMSFLSAHAAKPARQADMRMFLESWGLR